MACDHHATLARQRHQSQGGWSWKYTTTLIQEKCGTSLPGVYCDATEQNRKGGLLHLEAA